MSKYVLDWCSTYKKAILKSDQLESLRDLYSIQDNTAHIKRRRTGGFAPSRKHAITKSGRFDIGLVPDVLTSIKAQDPSPDILLTELLHKNVFCRIDYTDIPKMVYDLYPYQEDAIKRCLKFGRGNIIVGTGGGKTLIMSTLIRTILQSNPSYKVVIILPPALINQTYTDFVHHGITPNLLSKWNGSSKYSPTSIVLASSKTVVSKSQDITPIENCDVLLCDEVHTVKKSNKITKVIKKVKTNNRIGLTGTLPDNKIDEWTIIGIFGPIIYEKSGADLREEGYITDAVVRRLIISYDDAPKIKPKFNDPTHAYNIEKKFTNEHPKKYKIIEKICNQYDNNVLILVDNIEPGEALEKHLRKSTDKEVFFIQGKVPNEDRDNIQKLMETRDDIICIAMSKIFSVGISINNIHHIIFTSIGKAKTKIIQSIGRGVRNHDRKLFLTIWDLIDKLKYGLQHGEKRTRLYEDERLRCIKYEL